MKLVIILVGIAYLGLAIEQYWWRGSLANGIVYTGYALSNVGLWMLAK